MSMIPTSASAVPASPSPADAPTDTGAIDLGYVPSYAMQDHERAKSQMTKGARPPKPPQPRYPSLNIEGDPASQVMATGLAPGQQVTATVTFNVVGTRQRSAKSGQDSSYDGDNSVELEATSILFSPSDQDDDEDDANQGQSASDAMDAYRASQGSGGAGEGDEEEG